MRLHPDGMVPPATEELTRMLKPSLTKQWMIEHPNDKPCPREPGAARAWRMKRFGPKALAERERYRLAMIETRRAEAALRNR